MRQTSKVESIDSCYEFESASHSGLVLSGLDRLREQSLLFDVVLIVEGQKFPAHRCVLAACSEYFRAMFTDAMRERQQDEIWLNGVSAEGLHILLDYAYTGRLTVNIITIQAVLSAASHLAIEPVVGACAKYLLDQIDLDSVVDILLLAETYCLPMLRKHAYVYAAKHLAIIAGTMEFSRISEKQLCHILSGDYPVGCSEVDVLHSVLSWLSLDTPPCACTPVDTVLSLVRLPDIPSVDLCQTVSSALLKSAEQHYPGVGGFISNSSSGTSSSFICSSSLGVLNSRGLDSAIVVVGGFHSEGVTNAVTYLPRGSDRWRSLTDVPHIEQSGFGLAVLNNMLYVVGGWFTHSMQEMPHPFGFRFCPISENWTCIAPMRQDRAGFYLGAVKGQLYAIGGPPDANAENKLCESYDPASDSWRDVASMPGCREQQAGCCHGDNIYICGGLDEWSNDVTTSFISYNINRDAWTALPDMTQGRADHCMSCAGDRLFVAGGWQEDLAAFHRILLRTIDVFDLVSSQWQTLTNSSTPRYLASLTIADEVLYFIGGFEQEVNENGFNRGTRKIERYDLKTDSWLSEQAYPHEIWEHASAALYVPTCRLEEEDELGAPDKTKHSSG